MHSNLAYILFPITQYVYRLLYPLFASELHMRIEQEEQYVTYLFSGILQQMTVPGGLLLAELDMYLGQEQYQKLYQSNSK